jgi:hypothetical protein
MDFATCRTACFAACWSLVHRAVERYWRKMLSSWSWQGRDPVEAIPADQGIQARGSQYR